MTLAEGVADWPDWRNERSYDYTARLTRHGWAWEFLRRNNEFQRDLGVVLGQAKYLEKNAQLDVVKSSVALTKWGIMFRRFVAARRQCTLVLGSLHARIADNR